MLFYPLGTALQLLGLAMLIGGLLALGAFTAPVLFKQFARPEAGQAMTVIFRRYDAVVLLAGLLVFVGEALRILAVGRLLTVGLWLPLFRLIVLLVLVALTVFTTQSLNPKLQAMQEAEAYTAGRHTGSHSFQQLHKQSEQLSKLQLLLSVVVLGLTPFI
jgi:hypothetical protein